MKNMRIHENESDYSVYMLYVEWGQKDHVRGNSESKHCFAPTFDEYDTG